MRRHIAFIGALLVVVLIFFNSWLTLNSHTLGDMITYYYPRAEALRQSIVDYGDFLPLWSPYIFSGDPFLAKPNVMNFFFILGPLLLVFPPMAALHLNVLLALFLSAVFMYFLVFQLSRDSFASFVAGIAYLLSGFALTTVIFYGWVTFANAYMLFPLLLIFLFRISSGRWLLNSILAGAVLGLFVIGGSGIEFLYATVMVAIFLGLSIIGRDLKARLARTLLVGVVILAVCLGLSAFKLLPVLEYQQSSVRAALSWQEASGRTIQPSGILTELVEPGIPRVFQTPSSKIGIVAFALLLFAVFRRPKSRPAIFFCAVIAVALLLATGSFLLYLFWKFYPGWSGMRYANRAIIMLVPAAAALAGLGAASLFQQLRHRSASAARIGFAVVVALLLLDLAVFGSGGQSNAGDARYEYRDIDEVVAANALMQNLSSMRQNSIFRIHTLETTGIDWGTEFYTAPLHLENIYGYDTQWLPEYLNRYLSAANNAPAVFWGILNVKYLTAQKPMNIPGFRLVSKFPECKTCFPEEKAIQKAWGPYLYENERFMPRAWIADNAILVVGEPGQARNAVFAIMLNPSFNASSAAVVQGRPRLSSHSIEELMAYKAVILTQGSVDSASDTRLQAYVSRGGRILPDLASGSNSVDDTQISSLLESLNGGSYAPVRDISTLSFSRKTIEATMPGFLVLSERYAFFPGWRASIEGRGEVELLKTDGAITAVRLEKPGFVAFEYMPPSFVAGRIITLLTLAVLAGLLIYFRLARQQK